MVNQQEIKTMQTDTLDQLMFMQLNAEMDRLAPDYWEEWNKGVVGPVGDVYTLTDEERDLVTRVVMAEARGEGYVGMLPVAQTILDRSSLWGMSVTEVITAPSQYADPYPGEITFEAQLAVSDVFDLGVRAYDEPVTHFHEVSITPDWTSDKACRGTVGNHRFWY